MTAITVKKTTTIVCTFEQGWVRYSTGEVNIIKNSLGRGRDDILTFPLQQVPQIIAALQELQLQIKALEYEHSVPTP